MITIRPALIVSLSSWVLAASATHADVIQLADGTAITGELAPPAEVVVKTATGERKVAFALLPADLQKVYWPKAAEMKAEVLPVADAPVTDEEISALAEEVNLDTWLQVAAIGSFRDKAEKRGAGGLVVTKAFNAIEENWLSVYPEKGPVGTAGNWSEQIAKAKAMEARSVQFLQKRWLEAFIKAAEAIGERDSNEFATLAKELKRARVASETATNFFTAK